MHAPLSAVLPALAAAAALAAGAAIVRPAVAGATAGDRVQVQVMGVLSSPDGAEGIVVLREKGAERILPVLVPGSGGRALRARLHGRPASGAGGLLAHALGALGAHVVEVELVRPHDGPSSTRVRIAQGRRSFDVDAGPGESLGIAVAQGAPIYVRRSVLEADGLTPEDIARLAARQRPHDLRL